MKTSPTKSSNWDDLTVRVTSAAVMTAIGAAGLFLGGVWFQTMVVFAIAVIVWEIWMMVAKDEPTTGMLLGVLSAALLSGTLAHSGTLALLLVVPVLGAIRLKTNRIVFFLFALGVLLAGHALVQYRVEQGFVFLLWLMSIVIVTNVFGYFAGKSFGGPKFWPKISPKKTWSGTVAGWIGAGFVGLIAYSFANTIGFEIILVSMVVSFAGQMGDIAESALKRRTGIKDSSDLIPGHGGLFDRFDALIGATLFLAVLKIVLDASGATF